MWICFFCGEVKRVLNSLWWAVINCGPTWETGRFESQSEFEGPEMNQFRFIRPNLNQIQVELLILNLIYICKSIINLISYKKITSLLLIQYTTTKSTTKNL